jgi:ParB family chromosome partitioning protein
MHRASPDPARIMRQRECRGYRAKVCSRKEDPAMATRGTKAPAKAGAKKKASARTAARRRLTPAASQRGLTAAEIALPLDDAGLGTLVDDVRAAGGVPVGAYRDPLGSRPLLVATLPLSAVQPTPFQRDLSPTHSKRLAEKIDEARAFLDPLIVVRGHDGRFWTPNGRHRLAAGKVLGLRQITALVSPDETLAYRILALNTEKAHNLKDRSLEVIRMARTLAKREPAAKEAQYADQFEAAELITLGIVYEQNPRFAGGAYSSFLKKVDRFSDRTIAAALREREGYADRLQAIDVEVKRVIAALEKRGFKSPYLRNYVVARINPVRWHVAKKGDRKPPMPIGQALTRMTAAVKGFDVGSVKSGDLAWVAVGAGAAE